MKKVLVISTSMRTGGNSDSLAEEFTKGAKDAGHEVEKINLLGKKIGFCLGCLACQKTGVCVIKDDAIAIAEKLMAADVVCFATPIYYYEMAGQMKTVLDRMNPLFDKDYAFRDVYMLSSACDESSTTDARALAGLEGWVECFPKAKLSGSVFAGGVTDKGDIQGHASLKKAFEMGKNI